MNKKQLVIAMALLTGASLHQEFRAHKAAMQDMRAENIVIFNEVVL